MAANTNAVLKMNPFLLLFPGISLIPVLPRMQFNTLWALMADTAGLVSLAQLVPS